MRFNNPWIDPCVRQVRTEDARSYLLRHDWKPKPFPRPQVLLFEGPPDDDGNPIVQVIPVGEPDAEFVQRMIELIGNLAIVADRPAVAVLNDILQASASGQPPIAGRGRRH